MTITTASSGTMEPSGPCLRIKDVAERTGFSAATLRYYEGIGLLPPASRTESGYRLYGDEAIQRLAFIARAKQLGCSLEEITVLAGVWEGGECGPVQDRLRVLVVDKLAETRRQIADLEVLAGELEVAAATLGDHRPIGPCDDRCGCVTESVEPSPVRLGRFGATA